MSAATSALPASVAALNRLLNERAAPGPGLRVALGVSYATHALALVALVLLLRADPRRDFGGSVSRGILDVAILYSPGAPPGPRPAARAVTAPPLPVEPPKPEPKSEPKPEPKPAVVPPARDADILKEARPQAKATPRTSAPAPGRAVASPEPKATGTPGGGTLPAKTGPPGSPTGSVQGDPDGGWTSIVFGNRWYAGRVQDIVYSNWGDPFVAQPKPAGVLVAVVRFAILRDGSIGEFELEKPSGSPAWDRSALRAVENSKLPPLPSDYPGSRLVVHYQFSQEATP